MIFGTGSTVLESTLHALHTKFLVMVKTDIPECNRCLEAFPSVIVDSLDTFVAKASDMRSDFCSKEELKHLLNDSECMKILVITASMYINSKSKLTEVFNICK